jgi:hypothetical protein
MSMTLPAMLQAWAEYFLNVPLRLKNLTLIMPNAELRRAADEL